MKIANEAYLKELADEALAGQVSIAWAAFARSALRGETIWIDATVEQPAVEVEFNYTRSADAVVIDVIAYQSDDDNNVLASYAVQGVVRK